MKLHMALWEDNNPFPNLFQNINVIKTPDEIEADGILLLWGGEDISPSLYAEKANKYVYASKYPSQRDLDEITLIKGALERNRPIIGICRGAQLLCVMAGGTLAQHIDGHDRNHPVTLHDEDESVISCNSTHHQMMMPPASAKILASTDGTWGVNQFNNIIQHPRVNEVVYFPNVRGLGIQPHPEWTNCPSKFVQYCERKVQQWLIPTPGLNP